MGEIIPHSSRKSSRTFSQSPLPKANALVRISKRPASFYNGLSTTAKWLPPREYENRPSSPPSSLSLSLPGCASLELSSRGPGRSASKVEVDDSIIEGRARAFFPRKRACTLRFPRRRAWRREEEILFSAALNRRASSASPGSVRVHAREATRYSPATKGEEVREARRDRRFFSIGALLSCY